MKSKQNWIRVEDCLPEEGQHILYRARYDGLNTGLEQEEIEQEMFYSFKFGWLEDNAKERGVKNYKVTHWLPIPSTNYIEDTESEEIKVYPNEPGKFPEQIVPNLGPSVYGWNDIPFPCVVGLTKEEAEQPLFDPQFGGTVAKTAWRVFNLPNCGMIWDRSKVLFWRFLTKSEQRQVIHHWKEEGKF